MLVHLLDLENVLQLLQPTTCANICTLQMTRIKMQFLNWKLKIQSDHIGRYLTAQ